MKQWKSICVVLALAIPILYGMIKNWKEMNVKPIPLSREAQIQVYKDKQTSLATQFQNSKQGYYSAGLSVSKTDDFSEQMNRIRARDSHVVNMRKIKTEYASLEKEVATFYGGTLPEWWHDNSTKDSDKWNFVFKLEAL